MKTFGIMTSVQSVDPQNPDVPDHKSVLHFSDSADDFCAFLRSAHPQIRKCIDCIGAELGYDVCTRDTAFYVEVGLDEFEQIRNVKIDEHIFESPVVCLNTVFSSEGIDYFIGSNLETVKAMAC